MPTVSVVIPAHNAEETIAKAIGSIRAQTVSPDETVVACDKCSDSTAQIAGDLGATVVELDAGNGSAARNFAAKAAKGEIFFFLDADDWWEPKKIESHLSVWEEFDGSFVIDRSTPINPDGSPSYWRGGIDARGEAGWERYLYYKSWACGSSFSVKRDSYWEIGGFNDSLNKFQDVDFWVRCAHARGPAFTMPESFTNYQLSGGATVSKTTAFIEENLQAAFEGWPFATGSQKEQFRSHAYLTAAEVTPWPASISYFREAHWPVSRRFFWKCLFQSLKAPRSA